MVSATSRRTAKPVLNVFRMLGRMRGDFVKVESSGALPLDVVRETGVRERPDINAIATRQGRSVAILVWNYHDDDLAAGPAHVELSVEGLSERRVTVEHNRIDADHSNAHEAWKRMGHRRRRRRRSRTVGEIWTAGTDRPAADARRRRRACAADGAAAPGRVPLPASLGGDHDDVPHLSTAHNRCIFDDSAHVRPGALDARTRRGLAEGERLADWLELHPEHRDQPARDGQADTFDEATIDRELGWAKGLGFNSMRVFLHDLLWNQDSDGFLRRIDRFLEIANRHQIGVMLVLFDGVWDPNPQLGKQRAGSRTFTTPAGSRVLARPFSEIRSATRTSGRMSKASCAAFGTTNACTHGMSSTSQTT